jgi:hypothetical protein
VILFGCIYRSGMKIFERLWLATRPLKSLQFRLNGEVFVTQNSGRILLAHWQLQCGERIRMDRANAAILPTRSLICHSEPLLHRAARMRIKSKRAQRVPSASDTHLIVGLA